MSLSLRGVAMEAGSDEEAPVAGSRSNSPRVHSEETDSSDSGVVIYKESSDRRSDVLPNNKNIDFRTHVEKPIENMWTWEPYGTEDRSFLAPKKKSHESEKK